MDLPAFIFDLDGVIVSTDEFHYRGWKQMADEEDICFDREINERLRGVSRMESLSIILEKASKSFSQDERGQMANRKNTYYRDLLESLSPLNILPGVMDFLNDLKTEIKLIAIVVDPIKEPQFNTRAWGTSKDRQLENKAFGNG